MKCSKIQPMLVALLDSELSRSQEEQVLQHLESCAACAQDLERLESSTPVAPVIHLAAPLRHDVHLAIERALDQAELEPAPTPAPVGWRAALGAEVPVPRGLLVLYAAALLLAIGWAARGTLLEPQSAAIATSPQAEQTQAPPAVTLHRPAAYTPSEGWF